MREPNAKWRLALLLTLVLVGILFVPGPDANAQDKAPAFEIGGQVVRLRVDDDDPSLVSTDSKGFRRQKFTGGGGRFTFNLTNVVAFEAEANAFSKQNLTYHVVAGIKVGYRTEHFGVFGKARPGFAHFLRVSDTGPRCLDRSDCGTHGRNEFVTDLGGVLEFYPIRQVAVRFDAGDLILRVGERGGFGRIPDPTSGNVGPIVIPAAVTHNLQFSIGVSYRF